MDREFTNSIPVIPIEQLRTQSNKPVGFFSFCVILAIVIAIICGSLGFPVGQAFFSALLLIFLSAFILLVYVAKSENSEKTDLEEVSNKQDESADLEEIFNKEELKLLRAANMEKNMTMMYRDYESILKQRLGSRISNSKHIPKYFEFHAGSVIVNPGKIIHSEGLPSDGAKMRILELLDRWDRLTDPQRNDELLSIAFLFRRTTKLDWEIRHTNLGRQNYHGPTETFREN